MAGDPYPQDGQTLTNQTPPKPRGFFGSGGAAPPANSPAYQPAAPPLSQQDEWRQRASYGGSFNGANDASNRYQQMGQQGADRGAYAQDFGMFNGEMGQSQGARGAQTDALSLQRDAAMGNAPSKAEILGRQIGNDSVAAAQSVAAGARGGPMAQASALQSAQDATATQRQQQATAMSGLRADEMSRARDAYMGGASTIRQGDFTGAGLGLQQTQTQTQNEQFQRGLNQQDQQYYEGLGNQVQEDQMKSAEAEHGIAEQGHETQAAVGQHSQDRASGVIGGAISGIAGAAGGAIGSIFSDDRSKATLTPLSRQTQMGALPPWLPPYAFPATSLLTSDKESKQDARDLGRAEGVAAAASQWSPSYAAGSQEAPHGYAAARAGQSGYMFGNPQPADTGQPAGAPGTADWAKYGAPASGAGDVDWGHGGATAPPPPMPPPQGASFGGAVGAGLGGFSRGFSMQPIKSDENSKTGMMSLSQSGGIDKPTHDFLAGNVFSGLNDQNDKIAGSMIGAGHAMHMGPGMGKPTTGMDLTISDPRAKEAAYDLGLQHGVAAAAAGPAPRGVAHESKRPLYVSQTNADGSQEGYTTDKRAASGDLMMPAPAAGAGVATAPSKIAQPIAYAPIDPRAHEVVRESKRPIYVTQGPQEGYTNDPRAASGQLMMPPPGTEGPATASGKDPEYTKRYAKQEAEHDLRYTYSDERSKVLANIAHDPKAAAAGSDAGSKVGSDLAKRLRGMVMGEGTQRTDLTSDERSKSIMHGGATPPPEMAAPAFMMDGIGSGKAFRYKPGVPGTDPSMQHFGTTTQDLRKTPMGASMVVKDPGTGYEAIDTREAVGPVLASIGNLNERMRALEKKKGGR